MISYIYLYGLSLVGHSIVTRVLRLQCKIFLLSRFEPVYFQALSDSITEFKNVTVNELIEHISNKYPPKQEEINAVEATLRDQWDPTNHIENLFQPVKKGTETLLLMKAINEK
jgi:hypothetical protein